MAEMPEQRVSRGRALGVAVVGWALVAVACTANPPAAAADKDDAETASGEAGVAASDDAGGCQTGGLHTDTYAPDLQKTGGLASGNAEDAGGAGPLTFILESNEIDDAAAPPAEPFMNVFTLKLTDSTGTPIKDATVSLPAANEALGWSFSKNPWMPLMLHGSSIAPTVTNNQDGTYAISIYFSMAGLWQIYVVAQTTDGIADSAEYSFCLP
jgi:hypothetical protein